MSNRVQRQLSAGLAVAWIGAGTVGVAMAVGPKTVANKPAAAAPDVAKPTSAMTARKLASGKLGDFEDGSLERTKDGGGWAKFTFAQGAKQPTGEIKIVDGGKTGKKVLRFDGTIPDDAQMAFIGAGCGFGKAEDKQPPIDVSGYKGLRFDVRGDENPYRLALLCDAVKDYNYHGKNFVAEKEWATISVPFSDMKQIEGWGTPVPFTGKDVRVVSISTMFQFTGPAWFEIDNVELYK